MATILGATPGNDSLTGTNDPGDVINGLGGNDTIRALAGADLIGQGGTGNNLIYGNLGNDQITSTSVGADTIYGGQGYDFIDKQDGAGNNKLYGNIGNDTIYGGQGNDTTYGGQGNDALYDLVGGNNLIYGNRGNDTIIAGLSDLPTNGDDGTNNARREAIIAAGTDTVYGGQGADIIAILGPSNALLYGNLGADSMLGGQGNDKIFGGQGNDQIGGGEGKDTISGNLGADTMTGGTVDIDLATAAITGVNEDEAADVFRIAVGDTGNTAARADHILAFEGGTDQLDLAVAGSADNFIGAQSSTVTDFNSARAFANSLLTGRTYAYVTGQNGSDDNGYLFIDNSGDGRSDAAIVFDGGNLNTVKSSDIV